MLRPARLDETQNLGQEGISSRPLLDVEAGGLIRFRSLYQYTIQIIVEFFNAKYDNQALFF